MSSRSTSSPTTRPPSQRRARRRSRHKSSGPKSSNRCCAARPNGLVGSGRIRIAMAEGPDTGLRIARPTLSIAGQENGALSNGLLSLLIVEQTNGLYRCEALFSNWGNINSGTGFLYFDRTVLDFGKAMQVKLGTDVIFDGKIMGLEANFPEGEAPELNILAEDRFQDLRMTRRTRTFVDVSDADVISQIANEHGLSPSVDVNGPTYRVLAQINQSDLA